MSIWCSYPAVGFDDMHEPADDNPRGGQVRAYAEGWSNHHPTTDGEVETEANVGLASIAPWCVPGHGQEQELGWRCAGCGDYHDHPQSGPWVRLDVNSPAARTWWRKDDAGNPVVEPVHASVVLDEAAARQLAADLLAWADRPHLAPIATEEAS